VRRREDQSVSVPAIRPAARPPVAIKNLPTAMLHLVDGGGVDVHGAPARGLGLHTNGHLGADLLHVKAGDQFPVHTHPGDHLLYCLSGEGTITVDQVTYTIVPGDLYMVDGLVPHAVGAVTDHVILAIGAPHKAVDSPERMAFVDWDGQAVEVPISASETARRAGTPL
jgi:quercetin dioxygenase-like cupin family protein